MEYATYNWYSFTAPEEGYYSIDGSCTSGEIDIYLYPSSESYSYIDFEYIYSGSAGSLLTGKMEAGDTLYVKASTYYTEAQGTLTVKKLEEIKWEEQTDDGTYLAKSDAYSIKLTPEVGYANIRYTVEMTASGDSSLDSAYKVICKYTKQDSSSYRDEGSSYLYSYNNYLATCCLYVGSNTTYELFFTLEDNSGNVIAALDRDFVFTTTGSTENAVYIHKREVTETSIAMEWEEVDSAVSHYYCYASGQTEKVGNGNITYYDDSWMTYSFTGLQPATEYVFCFTDDNYKILYTETVSTKESDVKIEYTSAKIAADCSSLNVTANLSGYTDTENSDTSYACLCYEFTDALGRTKTGVISESLISEGWSDQTFEIKAPFAAGESYDIALWVTIGSNEVTKWGQTVKKVTAPEAAVSASDVILTVSANNTTSTTADYTVKGAGSNTTAYLYYRQQESLDDYSYETLSLTNGNASDSVTGLEAGMTYDFVLFVGGVLVEKTVTLGTGALSLTKVEDGSNEDNALDIVRTLQLKNTDETDTASTYYLHLYYWNGSSYTHIGYTELSTDNDYQATFRTVEYVYKHYLLPDTEYHLKWTVSAYYTGAAPSCTMYETVRTAEGFSAVSGTGTGTTQSFTVSLDNVENITNYVNYVDLYAYIKKNDEPFYVRSENMYLTPGEDYTVTFSGLEAETDYVVSWRLKTFSDSVEEIAATKFTTAEDTRQITVTNISSGLHRAEISYICTGGSDSYSYDEYALLYIREQGENNTWEKAYYNGFYNYSGTFYVSSYNGADLKVGTIYEYIIGIGSAYNTGMNQLEKTVTGTFQTAEDTRELSGIEVSRKYTSAVITGLCSGSSSDIYSYIHFFLRKKGESSWIEYDNPKGTSSSAYSFSKTFTGLTIGTAYEYAVVISDNYSCSGPDEVTAEKRKKTGEFTTLTCGYTLNWETEELTSDSAVLSVQATDSNNAADSKIQAVLTLSDGQSATVILKQSAGYQNSVTFSGLEGSKDYTVADAEISAFVDGSYEEIGTIACNYTFRTKDPIVPESITLSKDAAALNLAYVDSVKEGYGWVTLTVTAAAPTDAAKDVKWTSTDETVAKVDANGKVTAVSAGTATITAASKYAEEVTAACEVTVKNYVIGQEIDGSVTKVDIDDNLSLYKNGKALGYGLYDQSGEELTIVSGSTVTFSREGIVSWDNGTLTGITNGTAYVTMEKDGVKAGCYVTVSLEAKGFGITGFTTSNSDYPAQETGTGYLLAYAEDESVTYEAQGELSPAGTFSAGDFKWESSDESVAVVSNGGVVTPKSAGTVKLTVTPNTYSYSSGKYKQEKVEIVLTIKNTLSVTASAVYALANVSSTIGDVDIAGQLGEGWSWKYPKTPLVTNGINKDSYPFEAVYTGEDYYPVEKTVAVYIGKITGVTVSETGAAHNQVLETGGEDSLTLSVSPVYQGTLSSSSSLYTVDKTIKGGLTVDGENGTYTVTADKKGSHSITFTLKAGGKKLAETKYKITAVDGTQVRRITITSATGGVTISDDGKVILDASAETKSFTLQAAAVDRSGNEISTNLQWKSSDTSVASVAADKKDTHKAVVTRKGAGHTVITVIAKDTMGCKAYLDVEFQDHAPRVNVSKATVNIAYDYDNYLGKQYASAAGCVEIVPVYSEWVSNVTLVDKKENAQTILKAVQYSGYKYLIEPTTEEIKTDTYDYKLRVTTSTGTTYTYPMKVSVVNKAPTVSAKMSRKPNLFYLTDYGTISLSISGGYDVDSSSVVWQDQDEGAYNGFSLSGSSKTIYVYQQNIKMADGKLTDKNITKGTLSLKVRGFRKTYTFKNFEIKYTYKKPALTTNAATTKVFPSIGLNSNYFYVYNKTDKTNMCYGDGDSNYYYNELECSSDTVTVEPYDTSYYNSRLNYTYSGSAKQEKFTLTLGSANWRENLKVSHTVNAVQPTAYLSNSQLTYNTVSKSTTGTSVCVKNAAVGSPSLADVQIKGSNKNAQKLLDDDLLTVSWQDGSSYVSVTQNRLDILENTIPNGTYSYKLTPYYNNAATGEKTALNTLTLKVKVTNKAISAKVSAKGTLDLTNDDSYYDGSSHNAKNVVVVDPKLANAGTGYYISSYKLVGEYSGYFTLAYGYLSSSGYHRYIAIKNAGKLKAKQGYKLAIECTVQAPDGDSFTVTSNTFTIKPKQTAAKIKITNNNQTMYAGAADNLTRTYTLSATSSYYLIESVSGSLDCNKDGTADIVVSSGNNGSSWYSYPTVTIRDRDGVGASAKGKTLSIPVTVSLKGRDGVSVDAKTTIKVKVKR